MSKTSGQYLDENIEFFTNLAKKYLEEHFKNEKDVYYVPFAMRTYYTRAMIKKIDEDEYICFDGYVKDIKIDNFDKFQYVGNTNYKCNRYTKEEIIRLCAFEFSINNYYRELVEREKNVFK